MKDKTITDQEWFNKFTLEEKAMFFRRMLDELSECQSRVFNSIESTVFSQYQEEQINGNQK